MQSHATIQLRLINERRAEQLRDAAMSRRFEGPARSIRHAAGTTLVRLGTRLAGEPSYGLARSR